MTDPSDLLADALPVAIAELVRLVREAENEDTRLRAASALLSTMKRDLKITHAVERLTDEQLFSQLERYGWRRPKALKSGGS